MPHPTDELRLLESDGLDTQEKLRLLEAEYRRARECIETIESAHAAITTLQRLEAARSTWEADPEDTARGLVWAKETALLLGQLRAFLPDVGPGFINDYFQGLFSAVPKYVDAVASELAKHLREIDKAVASDGAVDFTVGSTTASCSNGRVDEQGIALIRSLGVDESVQMQIFRSACHAGMRSALRRHGFLARRSV